MGLVVDSSLIIAAERQRFRFDEFLNREASAESVYISAVTASELLHGVHRANDEAKRARRSQFVEAILDTVDAIPFDLSCAREHARIWAALEATGNRIGAHDLMIAATCVAMNHEIATLNEAEFRRVEGLKLIDAAPYRTDS